MSFGSQLVDKLRHYKKPLTITLDDGALVAASFDFGNSYAFSVIFRHPEGDVEIGANLPTRAEWIGIPAEDLSTASYTDLQAVVSDHLGQSCTLLDECPWAVGAGSDVISCFDASGEQVQESAAPREALIEWLRQEDEDALEDEHLYPELSEGLVGYAILEALPPAEVEYLGLKELDCSGGPGGGYAPRVVIEGDPNVLAAAIRRWKLPFELHV